MLKRQIISWKKYAENYNATMSDSMSASSSFTEWLQQTLSEYSKLDDVDKNTTINALINLSGPSQLYELSNRLPEFVFRDFISYLPAELIAPILQYLDGKQLLVCCQVCKSWNDTVNNLAGLWRWHALKAGADVSVVERDNFSFVEEITATVDRGQESRPPKGHIYKDLYLKAVATLRGFQTGKSIDIKEEFIDKKNWRITFVGYFDKHIVTGCDDHTVQVWDIPSGSVLTTVTTHSVCCLTVTDAYLYTASFNANAESWDLATRRHFQTFCGHTSAILAIDVTSDESFLLTGSVDKTAKLWDLRATPAELIKTFNDVHDDWVFEVKFLPSEAGQLQFITSDTGVCRLWLTKQTGDLINSSSVELAKSSKFTSFYHVQQDPFQMFTCQWEEDRKSSWLSKYFIQHKSCVIERKLHFQISLDAMKAYILGAGHKFAVVMCSISRKDFHVIDIPRQAVVATIATPDFCMLTRNGSTVTLCDTTWLNGFDFLTTKINTPIFAASVGRNTVILGTWSDNVNKA